MIKVYVKTISLSIKIIIFNDTNNFQERFKES